VGLLIAARMSQRLGGLSEADVERVRKLLERAGLRTEAPRIGAARAASFMSADKKVKAGRVRLVLLRSIGEAYVSGDYPDAALHDTLLAQFGA